MNIDIKELNRKVNIPAFLVKLGADRQTIRKLKGADYRCPCWFRGGDNPHGLGITFHAERSKWLLTDFLHKTFGNIDLIDFASNYCGHTFHSAVRLLQECASDEIADSDIMYSGSYEYREAKPLSKNVLELFEYGLHPYLHQRGYTPDTALHFGLGWSNVGELIDRIVIPVVDETGDLVAIQGRTFVDDNPKYIFMDGTGSQAKETLYNLFPARRSILERGWVLLVEGAPSVWRAYQYGLPNCVATLSTSVTEKQLQLLISLGVKIVLAFDYDVETSAGQLATLKLANRLKEANFSKGVYTLNIGSMGLEGAIDDLTPSEAKEALKTMKKLF